MYKLPMRKWFREHGMKVDKYVWKGKLSERDIELLKKTKRRLRKIRVKIG